MGVGLGVAVLGEDALLEPRVSPFLEPLRPELPDLDGKKHGPSRDALLVKNKYRAKRGNRT